MINGFENSSKGNELYTFRQIGNQRNIDAEIDKREAERERDRQTDRQTGRGRET